MNGVGALNQTERSYQFPVILYQLTIRICMQILNTFELKYILNQYIYTFIKMNALPHALNALSIAANGSAVSTAATNFAPKKTLYQTLLDRNSPNSEFDELDLKVIKKRYQVCFFVEASSEDIHDAVACMGTNNPSAVKDNVSKLKFKLPVN